MSALDLFAGTGWGVACQNLGIEEEGVEIMREAVASRDTAGFKTVGGDVWDFEPGRDYDGLIASPPCQTFSMAGKGSGRKALDDVLTVLWQGAWRTKLGLRDAAEQFGDARTGLVLTPLHFWHIMRPEWVAWEQVPTVLPVWEACAEVMRAEGYNVWTGNLQAEMYGVPQTRKRAFLLARRDGPVAPPVPTHSRYYSRDPKRLDEGVQKWVSMAEALDWGLTRRPSPTITGGGTDTGGAEPIAKLARYTSRPDWVLRHNAGERDRPRDSETGKQIIRDAERDYYLRFPMNLPAPTISTQANAWSWEQRPEWAFNRPSTTIVGSFKPEIVAAPGYRTTVSRQNAPDSVRVTVQEAAVLQSYPPDFVFEGAKGKQFLQVGNAVPPLLATRVLEAVT